MLEMRLACDAAPPSGRCAVVGCASGAGRTPVLRIALLGGERVSHIPLPTNICEAHATSFRERFLTSARRAAIEASLRSHGRNAPDWSRTDVAFE